MRVVPPYGNPSTAKIILVGEAPGADEERLLQPFVGTSGSFLMDFLLRNGIRREDCYITNVVNIRPPGNDIRRLPELGLSEEKFYPRLLDEIRSCSSHVILALGNTPLRALTGQTGVTKWRGSVLFNYDTGKKVIPTIHPAACLRQWRDSNLLLFDIKRAVSQLAYPEIRVRDRVFLINPSFEECLAELDRLSRDATHISLDLETYMHSGLIKMIGLSGDADRAICIPLMRNMTPIWTRTEEAHLWKRIVSLLLSKRVIAQNAQFEMTQLRPYTAGKLVPWMDTMRAHALLYPEFPHSLAFMTSIYTDMPYYKDDGKLSDGKTDASAWDKLCIYNCRDVLSTFEIAMKLDEELKEANLHEFYHNYDAPLLYTLWKMSTRGVLIDKEKMESLRVEVEGGIEKAKQDFTSLVGHDVNVKSNKQMCQFLYEDLRLPRKFKKDSPNPTANEEALRELYRVSKKPELALLLEQRRLRTLRETFLDMKVAPDGRIHTVYGLTETGRLSSSKDIFGSGANLQNLPKRKGKFIRSIFIPSPGRILVAGDLSQAEARMVAWLSRDPTFKGIFQSGKDVHKMYASLLFSTPYEDVTDDQRSVAKNLRHARNYDMGPITMAKHLSISVAEAKSLLAEDDRIFPSIKGVFHREVQDALRARRQLITPWGRKRTFTDRWGDSLFKEAYAYIPQSSVADIINNALIALDSCLPPGADLLMQVHDEIVIECEPSLLDEVIYLMRYHMELPLLVGGDFLVIPVDISTGPNWADLKEVKDDHSSSDPAS